MCFLNLGVKGLKRRYWRTNEGQSVGLTVTHSLQHQRHKARNFWKRGISAAWDHVSTNWKFDVRRDKTTHLRGTVTWIRNISNGRLESAPTRTRRTRRSSAPWSACSTCSSRRSSGNKSSVKRLPRHRSGDFRPTSPGRVYRSVLSGRTMWAFGSQRPRWSGTRHSWSASRIEPARCCLSLFCGRLHWTKCTNRILRLILREKGKVIGDDWLLQSQNVLRRSWKCQWQTASYPTRIDQHKTSTGQRRTREPASSQPKDSEWMLRLLSFYLLGSQHNEDNNRKKRRCIPTLLPEFRPPNCGRLSHSDLMGLFLQHKFATFNCTYDSNYSIRFVRKLKNNLTHQQAVKRCNAAFALSSWTCSARICHFKNPFWWKGSAHVSTNHTSPRTFQTMEKCGLKSWLFYDDFVISTGAWKGVHHASERQFVMTDLDYARDGRSNFFAFWTGELIIPGWIGIFKYDAEYSSLQVNSNFPPESSPGINKK